QIYQRVLLDADTVREVRPRVSGLPTATAADIVRRAKARYDTERPDAAQLIVAATSNPCQRLAKALHLLGVPARSVAFEAALDNARANRIGTEIITPTSVFTILNFIVSLTVTLLVVWHVVHDWWPAILVGLAVIYLAWTGHIISNIVM